MLLGVTKADLGERLYIHGVALGMARIANHEICLRGRTGRVTASHGDRDDLLCFGISAVQRTYDLAKALVERFIRECELGRY